MFGGLFVSNGLAWSPDGRTMFHSDTGTAFIDRFDFDSDTGVIANRQRFAEAKDDIGRPDGAAYAIDGTYWSAGVSGGALNGFSPDGTLVRRVPVPMPHPTMPCFGGPDLRTVFVTSPS